LGKKIPLKINMLREHDGAVTGNPGRQALAGAVVEYGSRAQAGFADG
jgi:ribonuclease HI